MEYELAKDIDVEKEVNISVSKAELEDLIDKESEKLRREIKLDGFRKGRVPKSLIKQRFQESLKAQAMDRLVNESYLKILKEKKWHPASQAELLKMEEGDQIKFRLHFEVIPDVIVDNYRDLEVFKESPMPEEFLLEQGLKALREQYATIIEISRPAAVDDIVTIDLEISEGNKVDKKNDLVILIGDRNLPDELNRALVGVKKSEKKEINITNKLYKLVIKKIEEKNLPQIDDAFAKKLNFDNVEELKRKLLEDLKMKEEKRIEDEIKESLSEIILERIQFNTPPSMVKREYEKMLKEYNIPDSESNKERFWRVAEKRVRLNIILDKIAENENIKVGEAEILDFISKMGIKLSAQNRNDIINYIGNILNKEKTIDFLYKNARVSEKSRIVTPREVINDTHTVRH